MRTYIPLGRVHEEAALVVPPVVPLAPEDFSGAFLVQSLGPWDFLPEPLPNFLDGAHVLRATPGRTPSSRSSDRAELHDHSYGYSCLATTFEISSGC